MARKTDGEKIDELTKLVVVLEEGLKAALKQVNAVYDAHSKTAETLSEMRREHEKEIALLKSAVEEIKKWKEDQKKEHDEHSRRLWAFGPNLLTAIISIIGVFISLAGSLAIAYLVKR